jgi:hypothetical protein
VHSNNYAPGFPITLAVIGAATRWSFAHSKGRAMADALNAKANAVRLVRERPRNFRTADRSRRWRWIKRETVSGFAGVLIASGASEPCATSYRATALRRATAAMAASTHHDEREARRRSADLGSRDMTAPADLRYETTAVASPAARRPEGARPIDGPVVSLTPKPIIEAEELLGADTPDFPTDELAKKVLVHGETAAAPAGRADNFSWPRQDIVFPRWNTEIATTEPSDRAQNRSKSESMSRTQQ